MFVSNAKVRIVGLGGRSRKRRPHRRRLAVKEVVRMPCLLPTTVIVFLGLVAVGGGAGMSVIGYIPNNTTSSIGNATMGQPHSVDFENKPYTLKMCSYIGPVIMAIGMFAMIVACVFYCEILDKYAILVPDRKGAIYDKEELYEVIVGEMKKSYAQTLITAYSKAAERSLLMDNISSSGDFLPEPIFPYKVNEPLTLEQQIDIECEGYTPSPPIPNKRYSVIQARIQRLRSEDNWLKTSSLPNIRRSISIKRAGRVGAKVKDSRTLSYDYTMDEARLRRKSMMLRSLVQWNSESSEMIAQRQRRFSSVKVLPSHRRASLDEIFPQGFGSFPLTRFIQRRGTFACGDMRTRRMKFLLLLEASESQDGFNDSSSMDGRATVAGIRRNSFIPYSTCDRFIAGEEKKTIRDRRRSSVNPFSFGNRFGNTIPQPGNRRHSFFPIRRDDKIYVGDQNGQRRHSFNPIGVNNTFKPEFDPNSDQRRTSFNPDSLPDRTGERRLSHLQSQNSRFLKVPGIELDPFMEKRPAATNDDMPTRPEKTVSDSSFNYFSQRSSQGLQEVKRVERRHSFNPLVRVSVVNNAVGDAPQTLKVPKIAVNAESPTNPAGTGRFLAVPSQEYYLEERERRHSFNTPPTTKMTTPSTASTSKAPVDNKPASQQRISFKMTPDPPSGHLSIPSSQSATNKSTLKTSKPTSEPVRPSSFKQEMMVFKPLHQPSESRTTSPNSNASCCGSERVGSLGPSSRTASISSDRSAKTTLTISPVSVVAADGVMSYGTFKPSSPKTLRASAKSPDAKPKNVPSQSTDLDVSSQSTRPLVTGANLVRKSSSFRDTRGKGRSHHHRVFMDSPGSTSSGPATLSPSLIMDANAAIQRSKSASALPEIEVTRSPSPQTPLSYAIVPKPSSPLVARHKRQSGGQNMDKKSS